MTNLERRCRKALLAYVRKEHHDAQSVSHIHPRAYVVGKVASSCLIVSYPPMDSSNLLKSMQKDLPTDSINTIRDFDESLGMGDWCTIGYVCRMGCQETVAIKAVE